MEDNWYFFLINVFKYHVSCTDGKISVRHPTRPAVDVSKLTKGLQEGTQLIDWEDGKTENKGNSIYDSNFLPYVRLINCGFHLFQSSASSFSSQYLLFLKSSMSCVFLLPTSFASVVWPSMAP